MTLDADYEWLEALGLRAEALDGTLDKLEPRQDGAWRAEGFPVVYFADDAQRGRILAGEAQPVAVVVEDPSHDMPTVFIALDEGEAVEHAVRHYTDGVLDTMKGQERPIDG